MTHKDLTHFFHIKQEQKHFIDEFLRKILSSDDLPAHTLSSFSYWMQNMLKELRVDHLGWIEFWLKTLVDGGHFVLLEIIVSPLSPEIVSKFDEELIQRCFEKNFPDENKEIVTSR